MSNETNTNEVEDQNEITRPLRRVTLIMNMISSMTEEQLQAHMEELDN